MKTHEFWKRIQQMEAATHYAHDAIQKGETAKALKVCREVIVPRLVIAWNEVKPVAIRQGWIADNGGCECPHLTTDAHNQ